MGMIDPIKLAEEMKKVVLRGEKRKYYRFRAAGFYGGIATADCVGCNLRCIFCWAWNIVTRPQHAGSFYSPEEVTKKLISIAKNRGYRKIRISGNEPTLCREHLISVLEGIPQDYLFILETNGILIDSDYARELSRFENLYVRVSLKGSNKEEFSKLTGAKPEFFNYQINALRNLEKHGVDYHPAVISLVKDIEHLTEILQDINPELPEKLEIEPLIKYPGVMERLKKIGFEVNIL